MGKKVIEVLRRLRGGVMAVRDRASEILRGESGASHFIEMLIGILIVVVVGALFVEQSRTMILNFFTFLWDKIKSVFTI